MNLKSLYFFIIPHGPLLYNKDFSTRILPIPSNIMQMIRWIKELPFIIAARKLVIDVVNDSMLYIYL